MFLLKSAPFWGDIDPDLTHGSVGPHESAPQMASRSVQPFLTQLTRVPYTDTDTDTHRQTDKHTEH